MIRGIFAIYKQAGPTSNDVLEELRKITGVKKIGHAGTLDPLARGVLVVGIGREATRRLHSVVEEEKEYAAKIRLGAKSMTDDEEGEKEEVRVTSPPSREEIEKMTPFFRGTILQTPPLYSAVKVDGREAYKYARKGREVTLRPREVLIKEMEILQYRWPYLTLRVITGPGAYIRALARDIGGMLKTGGYLAELERVRVGQFLKKDAKTLEDIKQRFVAMRKGKT